MQYAQNERTKTTKGNDHIVGYGDAVRGRGLLRPGAVLSVPQKSPRAPGLRLPIRSTPQGGHRVTIGTCLKNLNFISSCGPTYTCWRETSAAPRLSSCLSLLLFLTLSHVLCLCDLRRTPFSVSIYFSVSPLSPLVYFMIFFSA